MIIRGKPLVIILAIGAALRLVFFSGYQGADDSAYIAHAAAYAAGDLSGPYSHWGVRAGIVVPTAIVFYFFGVSELSSVALPFILSVATIGIAYALSDLLFNARVANIAALLVAVFPMEVLYATQLYPYTFLSFFLSLSLLWFAKGEATGASRYYIVSGLSLGFAYLCRITALYSLLFFGFMAIRKRFRVYWLFPFTAGLLFVVSSEMLMNRLQTDNALYRLSILAEKSSNASIAGNFENSLAWFLEPFLRPLMEQEFGLFFPVIAWAVLVCVRNYGLRLNAVTMLLFWVVPIFLYLFYGPTSPSGYSPLSRAPRYYSMIIVPALVIVGFALSELKSRNVRIAVISVLAATSLMMLFIDGADSSVARQRDAHEFILEHQNEGVVVHRSLYFDHLFFNKFKTHEGIKLLAFENDVSDELKRILLAAPEAEAFPSIESACGIYLVGDLFHLRKDPQWPSHESNIVMRFSRPDSIVTKLLRFEIVQVVLRQVSSEKRLRRLIQRLEDGFVAVRMDRPC